MNRKSYLTFEMTLYILPTLYRWILLSKQKQIEQQRASRGWRITLGDTAIIMNWILNYDIATLATLTLHW